MTIKQFCTRDEVQTLKKIILSTLLILLLTTAGCSAQAADMKDQTQDKSEDAVVAQVAEEIVLYEPQTFTYEIYGETYDVTYTQAPQRAVTMSQFMTEMLLALDLGDRMVGTAFMDNDIYPEYKEVYDNIQVLSDKYPSKEVMYSVEPDFISGWTSVFNEKRVASASEMMENGIHPFLAKSISGQGSIESVYEDFENLGRIFDVNDKAQAVVDKMQTEIAEIKAQVGVLSEDQKVKVFVYDSGDNEPFVVAGGGISGDIIKQAQGENIFGYIEKGYATVSWEEVVLRNPEVIVIVDYGDTSADLKLELLKNHPALQDVAAVKNDNFVVIGLADLSPGIRNTSAIRLLAEGFYPEKFN